jgi:hypothetical protein
MNIASAVRAANRKMPAFVIQEAEFAGIEKNPPLPILENCIGLP